MIDRTSDGILLLINAIKQANDTDFVDLCKQLPYPGTGFAFMIGCPQDDFIEILKDAYTYRRVLEGLRRPLTGG